MSLFKRGGQESSPEQQKLVEEMKVVAKAHEIYKQLVREGEVKNIMDIPKGGSELDGAIQNVWEKVAEKLREAKFEITEEIGKKFRAELDDAWGLKHVGVDY